MKKRISESRDIFAHSFIEDIPSPLENCTRASLSHVDRLICRPVTAEYHSPEAQPKDSAMQNYNNTI